MSVRFRHLRLSRVAALYLLCLELIGGLYRENEKENGNYYIILGFIGIMKKKMETIILYRDYIGLFWSYIGIMEKKMETTIV